MSAVIDKMKNYAASFDPFVRERAGEPDWLLELRRGAHGLFSSMGFPSARHEDWRWTNLQALTQIGASRVAAAPDLDASALTPYSFGGMKAARLVFVNGHFASGLSDTSLISGGVTVRNLSAGIANGAAGTLRQQLGHIAAIDERAFIAMNTAFMTDGAIIDVPANTVVETPIHVLCLTTDGDAPVVSHPRNLIVAGAGSRVTVIETHAGPSGAAYFTNPVTEVLCGEKSNVTVLKIQREGDGAFHIGTTAVRQEAESNFHSTTIHLGGHLVRNESHVRLNGEGCECTMNGLSLGRGSQLIDNHTRLDHAMPNCDSHQLFKSILDGSSRSVFDGKILVRRDAQKTDAKQTARALLLSDDAISNNKPQLEIYADDVKCTHGATTGQLDEMAVFYLRARGIDLDAARTMLTYAFACDVADRIENEAVRKDVEREFLELLPMGELVMDAL